MKKSLFFLITLLVVLNASAQRTRKTPFKSCSVIIVGTNYTPEQNYPAKMKEALIKNGFTVQQKNDTLQMLTSMPIKFKSGTQIITLRAQTDDVIIQSEYKYNHDYYKAHHHNASDFSDKQYQVVLYDKNSPLILACFKNMEKLAKTIMVDGRKIYTF